MSDLQKQAAYCERIAALNLNELLRARVAAVASYERFAFAVDSGKPVTGHIADFLFVIAEIEKRLANAG